MATNYTQPTFEELEEYERQGKLSLRGRKLLRQQRTQRARETLPETGPFQRAMIGAGKALMDVPRGLEQMRLGVMDPASLEEYQRRINEELGFFRELQQAYPVSVGAGEFAGEMAKTAAIPTIGRTTGGRLVSATGIEAGMGGAGYVPSGSEMERLQQAGIVGAGGLAGQSVMEGLRGVTRSMMSPEPPPSIAPEVMSPEITPEVPQPGRPPRPYGFWDEEFGIPYTEGLYTGRLSRQKKEERMRHGAFGPKRKEDLDNLLAFMRLRGEGAYRGVEQDIAGVPLQSGPQATRQLSRRMSEAADDLWSNVDDAFEAARANRSYLTPEDTQVVLDTLRNSLDQYDLISPEVNPNTHVLLERLNEFVPQVGEGQEVVGMDAKALHGLRMMINNLRDASGSNLSDARNLRTLRHTLDQELLRLADEGRLMGDPEGVQNLRRGIQLRADYGKLYGPRLSRSRSGRLRKDKVGEKIEDLVEGAIEPEAFRNWAFGKTTLDPGGPWASVADRIADVYGRESPEYGMFKNIFLEELRNSVLNAQRDFISPSKLNTMWRKLKGNPERLARIMTPDEASRFDRLVKAFKRMDPHRDAVNFSNTGHMIEDALEGMSKKAAAAVGAGAGGPAGAVAAYAGMSTLEKLGSVVKRLFGQRVFEPLPITHQRMGYVRATAYPWSQTPEEQEAERIRTGPIPGM